MMADLQYGGFGRRFGAMWLDVLCLSPLVILNLWGNSAFRLFQAYYFIPGLLISALYSIYLVKRFGGTPGKLILGLRITKVDGSPVGYREAILRELPNYLFHIVLSVGLVASALHLTDAEYFALGWKERSIRLKELAPGFYGPVQIAQTVWIWSEFLVLLTNEKKRAIHDFIAGTVVIVKESNQLVQRTEAAAQPPPLT